MQVQRRLGFVNPIQHSLLGPIDVKHIDSYVAVGYQSRERFIVHKTALIPQPWLTRGVVEKTVKTDCRISRLNYSEVTGERLGRFSDVRMCTHLEIGDGYIDLSIWPRLGWQITAIIECRVHRVCRHRLMMLDAPCSVSGHVDVQ